MLHICARSLFLIVLSLAGVARPAAAQPPGTPTPANYVDLGDIGIGQTVQSADQVLPAGLYVWFRFRLTAPITRATWLDLDTYGPGIITNNEAALYDNRKNLVAIDNDSAGSGPSGTNLAAAMSFGGGSGQRLTLDPAGGVISDGFSGDLPAGIYWLCIAAFDSVFPDPNNNWDTTTANTVTGNVRLKLTTGTVATGVWNERFHGDAGALPETAQAVEGNGPLSTILASFNARGRDAFKVRICDPATFSATVEATSTGDGGGGNLGSRLFLLRTDGTAIIAINRCVDMPTTITVPAGTPAGDYVLVTTLNCAGENGFQSTAYTATGQLVFDFSSNTTCNNVILPNGPGAQQPVAYWGRQADCRSPGTLIQKITFTGACYVRDTCRVADFDLNSHVEPADVSSFVSAWFAALTGGCP